MEFATKYINKTLHNFCKFEISAMLYLEKYHCNGLYLNYLLLCLFLYNLLVIDFGTKAETCSRQQN